MTDNGATGHGTPEITGTQAALEYLSEFVHMLRCVNCGGHWVVAKKCEVIYHACTAATRTQTWGDPPSMDEDRREWAAHLLGADLRTRVDAWPDATTEQNHDQ